MEVPREAEGLLEKIRPPRLEDAGLEDCALPPESIKEAFLKAATVVGSRATSIFTASGDETDACLNDPWPTAKKSSDVLVGTAAGTDIPGACAAEKGGGMPYIPGDKVEAGESDPTESADKVVGPGVPEGGEESCVDALRGLDIGDKDTKLKKEELDEEEKEGERPILAEAYM